MALPPKFDKPQATRLLHRIYRALREEDIPLRLNRELYCFGVINWATIQIHPYSGEFIETLVHEGIHMAYPEMDETGVIKLEKKMVKLLSDRQLGNLLKRYAELIGGD